MELEIKVDKLKPINGNVFVKQEVVEQKTKSGIILSSARQKHLIQSKGTVIVFDNEIGAQCYMVLRKGQKPVFETRELKAGDIAFFDQYAGKYQIINGQEYIVLKFDEIIGIVESDDIEIQFGSGGLETMDLQQLQQHMN